jgi:hypothetical protein
MPAVDPFCSSLFAWMIAISLLGGLCRAMMPLSPVTRATTVPQQLDATFGDDRLRYMNPATIRGWQELAVA